MEIQLSEAQLAGMVLMGLLTITLTLLLPQRVAADRVFNRARLLLAVGTGLLGLHFIVQYIVQKPGEIEAEQRALINLLFLMPCSYSINMSLLYLQRRGHISHWEWLTAPVAYGVSILLIAAAKLYDRSPFFVITPLTLVAEYTMSGLYALALITYNLLQYREYRRIRRALDNFYDRSMEALVAWTKWSMLLLGLSALLVPFVLFKNGQFIRIYGLLVLCTIYYYVFSFVCYGVSSDAMTVDAAGASAAEDENSAGEDGTATSGNDSEANGQQSHVSNERIAAAVDGWLAAKRYQQPGLTIHAVASEMGISRTSLRAWLYTTERCLFSQWIARLRIEEAKCLLLEHPDWSNETVAKACGFSDRIYFHRLFREIAGTTPIKWIEQNQKHPVRHYP
jgi:AraC-like DNA-binding protein